MIASFYLGAKRRAQGAEMRSTGCSTAHKGFKKKSLNFYSLSSKSP